jgi:HEPN domain-containing protein
MKKLTAEWVRKAEADIEAARLLAGTTPPVSDPACFHCQQAAEKYLKALLQELGLTIPKTHDLAGLIDLLLPRASTLKSFRRGLNRMSHFAVEYRYPRKHASARQVESALSQAERIRREIRTRLGLEAKLKRRKKSP